MSEKKYGDFEETNLGWKPSKSYPWDPIEYVGITCPACKNCFVELNTQNVKSSKASQCLKHIRRCSEYQTRNGVDSPNKRPPPNKRPRANDANVESTDALVTIYKIIFLPDNRAVYTGRTKDPVRRMKQHASASSGCRLLRNAIRRHGVSKFSIQPIVRCAAADADANESYYIMSNNTMHPNGYNLRHGSMAGIELDSETALTATGITTFEGAADELRARAEADADVAEMCEGLEGTTDDVCRDLLRIVHPDRAGGDRLYTPDEVTAMLNTIRESVRES